ncbi:RluA family pseudouridine synthase [Levilactobacillus bambusae]|uniref:Pseudouridine synthase n=1 Tax=Levilactobacillus bambusae TaxID=2024736 RepID=A0A2V1MZT9_9LACO|nr:RluA family pseudouridine synthase [Levilactobacillus bambusae]PWG00008.1 RluA family pseudouridine synthase [Levilactobacillus bambusae]
MGYQWTALGTEPVSVKRLAAEHGVSHRLFSDLKRNGSILIEDQPATFDQVVQPGQTLTVTFPTETSDPNVAVSDAAIEVLYEDDHLLVVNKPAGLNTVPGPANSTDTLVNRIKGHWVSQQSPNLVPHIITRLDRFTSGLVLVAHDRLANSLLMQQQGNHDIEKTYLALVDGTITADHDLIDAPLAQSPTGFNQIVTPDGKRAVTEYWVVNRFANMTLVRVKLHTGRTHQIRAHFANLGHPVVGDELYNGPMDRGIDHQALHAWQLDLMDPFTESSIRQEAPLPADFNRLMPNPD